VQFLRDPYEMAMSGYLYHFQLPMLDDIVAHTVWAVKNRVFWTPCGVILVVPST
jgi:hypothetical protein